ncbi:toll-like receptor 4 [Octopus sinensis]|uniref:Toll-like receptor 4 n=1 Tax=Octopus sinensis TaxID=2607531 RepID=A0A6P7SQK4_9MOLL|nr:toll-like receptor 4 [Octopus sinensis]XP_036359364.1 toll-like receptor 4 [Octopus sinensis]
MKRTFIIAFAYCMKMFIKVTANCQTDCPDVCNCTEIKFNRCTAICKDQNLTQSPDSFPKNTTVIDLSRNRIKSIPTDSLKHLNLLEVLKLDDNLLERFQPTTFQGLWSLRELSLEYNRLTMTYKSFPINLFQNLTKVKILKLRGNLLHISTTYIDKTISHLTSLEQLYMTGSIDSHFGAAYAKLSKLKYVSFATKRNSSQMSFLTDICFRNTLHIVSLNLSYSQISAIRVETFRHLNNLRVLDISYNKIHVGYIHFFKSFLSSYHLEYLVLNNINDGNNRGFPLFTPEASCLKYTSLKRFEFNYNRLEYIEPNFISSLPKTLEYAYLRNNILTYGKYLLEIKTLTNIKLIDISTTLSHKNLPLFRYKLLNRDTTYSFTISKSLKTLLLQGCHYQFPIPPFHIKDANAIRLINATNNLFCPWSGPVRGLEQLQILDLSHNQCNNISNEFFTYFTGLRLLNIENNAIGISGQVAKEGFSKAFLNLTSLEELHLSNNHVQYLSNNSLLQLKNLRILNLRNNLLKSFDVKISHMLNLSYLDLSKNVLQELSENTFNAIEKISEHHKFTVNIESNKLKCGCAQIRFLTWLHKVRNSGRLKIMYSKCTHPNGTVWELTDSRLPLIITYLNHRCSSFIGIIIAVTCLIVLLGCFSVGALVYHFRWKLRYLYYMIRERYAYQRIQTGEYLYDAFVSYAEEDRGCVVEYLIPELEEKDTFKLNIHHRDFPAGKQIAENILFAIQSSRKCLILLSRNFLASEWCMFEYNMAKMECVHTERDLVIVIMLEEFSVEILPLQLQHQVKTQSYICFPTDNAKTSDVFWNNLKKCIREG